MWVDRALTFLDGDEPGAQPAKVQAFETIFVLIVGTEYWLRAIPKWSGLSTAYSLSLASATLWCLLALVTRWRIAFVGLGLTQAVVIWQEFPAAGNHAYLELILCCLCAALSPRNEEERTLLLRSVRWIVCVVFFYGGLQKLVHGYYARGQYLAFSMWIGSFRDVVSYLLPAEEFARLAAYKGEVGDGPYLVSSPIFLALNHSIYLVEMALAPGLLLASTRRWAVCAAVAFLIGIEVAAREVFFGLVFMNALLLFVPSDLNRRLVPVFAAVLVLLILSRVGILPEVVFY